MKTKNVLILIAFATSLGFNVIALNSPSEDVSPCDNTNRYNDEQPGGGISIPLEEAIGLVTGYREAHKDDKSSYKTTGFYLSKRICDEVFRDGTANTLMLSFVENKGQLNLAVKAIHSPKSGIDKSAASNAFVLQTFCPDDCSGW